jgi:hypothetical protein
LISLFGIGMAKGQGRKRGDYWQHFHDERQVEGYKYARAECKHCGVSYSASAQSLKTHVSNCEKIPRSIGRISPSLPVDLTTASDSIINASSRTGSLTCTSTIASQLGGKVFPGINTEERNVLNQLFANAIHETTTQFDLFDHQAWQLLFKELMPNWNTPSPSAISTVYMNRKYEQTMMDVGKELLRAAAFIVGVDGATNVLSRSMSNVIAHTPLPWFVEYLRADLKKESEIEVANKLVNAFARLNTFMGREGVVFGFLSDSCNLMRSVRRNLFENAHVVFEYGCGAHPLSNFCEDIVKLDSIKSILRQALYVSKCIKHQGLLNKIFSEICLEMLGFSYAMVLYSASRWSSVNLMFCRLKLVKRPISALPMTVMNEKEERSIDDSYELPAEFALTIASAQFWRDVNQSLSIFDPICKCLGVLESDSSTMSTTYACFIYIFIHITNLMEGDDCDRLLKKLLYRWNRIYSPVHALALYCDPFYFGFRKNVFSVYGASVIELGNGDLSEQCRKGLKLLTRLDPNPDEAFHQLQSEFMRLGCEEAGFLKLTEGIINYQPRMIWSQLRGQYPTLASVLVKVYIAPGSASGVERQHKVGKRVHTARRNRTGSGKVERQVAIAHNASTAKRVLDCTRQKYEFIIQRTCDPEQVGDDQNNEPIEYQVRIPNIAQDEDDDTVDPILEILLESELNEQEALSRVLPVGGSVHEISDEILLSLSSLDLTQ